MNGETIQPTRAQALIFRGKATHVVVQQNLLPFLWRAGVLGGRTFDVLMTALPLKNLQTQLDFAASLHPESKTLADFRVDVVKEETKNTQSYFPLRPSGEKAVTKCAKPSKIWT